MSDLIPTPAPMAPGWYPTPSNPAFEKWWDGTAWTAQVRPAAAAPVPAVPQIVVLQQQKKRVRHGLHLLLTLLTGGLWLPVWLILAISA